MMGIAETDAFGGSACFGHHSGFPLPETGNRSDAPANAEISFNDQER